MDNLIQQVKSKIIIVADDTTGALDVAGSFCSRGYKTNVMFSASWNESSDSCLVIALNDRYGSDEDHLKTFEKIIRQIRSVKLMEMLFLKIDSSLRGNLISDVSTLSKLFEDKKILIAPAFPLYGRVCLNQQYLVDGVPVCESIFANDRSFRLASSKIASNFPNAVHIDIATIKCGPQALMEKIVKTDKKVFTFDTVDQSDLESIALVGKHLKAVCVGSSGLARAFPINPEQKNVENHMNIGNKIPSLFVLGSVHPKSKIQRNSLRALNFFEISLDRTTLYSDTVLANITYQLKHRLTSGQTAVLTSPDLFENDANYMRAIEKAIFKITAFSKPNHNLFVVGGETARSVFFSRNITRLNVCGELEPGVPICSPENILNGHIITKAGGFGSENVLNMFYENVYVN